jgi:hypothetical protein
MKMAENNGNNGESEEMSIMAAANNESNQWRNVGEEMANEIIMAYQRNGNNNQAEENERNEKWRIMSKCGNM